MKIREPELSLCASYDPIGLLTKMATHIGASSDYALAKALGIPATTISKIRNRRRNMTAGALLRMHDVTQLPVDTLRQWMGLKPYNSAKVNA